jgi:serine/threonine-protein kinase
MLCARMEPFALVVEEGPNPGERLPLPMGRVAVVGRAVDAQIRLPEDDKKVSRYQAMLEVKACGVEVQDLNSKNGTLVNGARVARALLSPGDVLRLGRTSFRLVSVPPAPTAAEDLEPAVTEGDSEDDSAAPPKLAPTLGMGQESCGACCATLMNLTPAPWAQASFLCDTCAARSRARRRGDEPAELGGFEVLRFLARGGMGAVYEGRQRGTAVRAALKVLSPELPPGHPLARRFLRERRLHATLVHERIVRSYGVNATSRSQEVCIAMEFVPGGDAERLGRRDSDLRQVVAIAADLFEGLAFGHERGLVHRDVKPTNLLLTAPDASGQIRAKLADYGLAKNLQEAGGGTTGTGLVAGSPFFVAPEQLLNFKRVGTSADIYGAAATLYYLLTGTTPLALAVPPQQADLATVCGAVLEPPRVPLSTRRPEAPAPLAEWLDAMLLRDPAHRGRVRTADVAPWLRAFA